MLLGSHGWCSQRQPSGEKNDQAADDVLRKYEPELYGVAEFKFSRQPLKEIYDEAIVKCQVTYDYAIKINEAVRMGSCRSAHCKIL